MDGIDLGFTTCGCCDSNWLLDCGGQRWMARPYSVDLRERMVRAVEAGASRRATAAKFEVSPSCVVKLLQRWRRRGTLAPEPVRGGRRAKLADHAERVQALLAAA